jgi:hypothetical protein
VEFVGGFGDQAALPGVGNPEELDARRDTARSTRRGDPEGTPDSLVVCRSIDDPGSEQTEVTVASCAPDFDHVTKSATDH